MLSEVHRNTQKKQIVYYRLRVVRRESMKGAVGLTGLVGLFTVIPCCLHENPKSK